MKYGCHPSEYGMSVLPVFLTLEVTVTVSPVKTIVFVARKGNGKPAKAPGQSQVKTAVQLSLSLSKLSNFHSWFCRNPWRACGAQLTLLISLYVVPRQVNCA